MSYKKILLVFLMILCSIVFINARHMPGEVLVKLKPPKIRTFKALSQDTSDNSKKLLLNKKYGIKKIKPIFSNQGKFSAMSTKRAKSKMDHSLYYKVQFSTSVDVQDVIKAYKENSDIEYAEPNHILSIPTYVPNDIDLQKQWGLTKTKVIEAQSMLKGTEQDVLIAVIDTGINYNHEDLKNNMWQDLGYDFCATTLVAGQEDNDPMDNPSSHGTAVAGIIGAEINNAKGIVGICKNVKLMAVKICPSIETANYNYKDSTAKILIQGISYAVNNGAKIINISIGGDINNSTLEDAIDDAINADVIVVCAAGNDGSNAEIYPAVYEGCIAVTASDKNDKKASFSNYGFWVDIIAPGVDIYTTNVNDLYSDVDGTSFAAPFVTGVVGLMLSVSPSLTTGAVRNILLTQVDDIYSSNLSYLDGQLGSGRLNVFKVLQALGLVLQDSNIQGDMNKIKIYPNPCYMYSYPKINISNIPSNLKNLEVKIYTINGEFLGEAQKYTDTFYTWNCKNEFGTPVASGMYLCHIKSNSKQKVKKVVLIN